jgi:hypothetical protein
MDDVQLLGSDIIRRTRFVEELETAFLQCVDSALVMPPNVQLVQLTMLTYEYEFLQHVGKFIWIAHLEPISLQIGK